MNIKKLSFLSALIIGSVFIVACSDDDGLSAADKVWIREQRLKEQYGSNTSTTTTTQTVTQTVTSTN